MKSPAGIAGVLIDIDGTLLTADALIPGVDAALAWLQKSGIPFRLVTNTTSKPLSAILARLEKAGLSIPRGDVFSAPVVARDYCRSHGLARCFPLLAPSLLEDLDGIEFVETAPDAVLIGDLGDELSYAALNQAFRFLMDGAAFITMARNRYFRGSDGLRLDVGSIVAALEYATQREAILIGKPASEFFLPALRSMDLRPEDALMIGDDLEADVLGAQKAGLQGVLVQTGKFRAVDLEKSSIKPDYILASLADLPHLPEHVAKVHSSENSPAL